MITNGVNAFYALSGFLIGAMVLTALFFLRIRRPALLVPSLMLFAVDSAVARRAVLFERFRRFLHWLLLLPALAAIAGALTLPVWRYREVGPLTIVADPNGRAAAEALFERGDPAATSLLIAGRMEQREYLAIAAGKVLYVGVEPPPLLPPDGVWVVPDEATDSPGEAVIASPLRFYYEGKAPGSLPPGVVVAESAAASDAIAGENEPLSELLWRTRSRRAGETANCQRQLVSPVSAASLAFEVGAVRLSPLLWAVALLIILSDAVLFLRRKVW